jgi:hypothetical protein
MNTTSEIEGNVSVELRIKGERANPLQPQWACLRFLGEAEIVDLLQDRLGKSEADVFPSLISLWMSQAFCEYTRRDNA